MFKTFKMFVTILMSNQNAIQLTYKTDLFVINHNNNNLNMVPMYN